MFSDMPQRRFARLLAMDLLLASTLSRGARFTRRLVAAFAVVALPAAAHHSLAPYDLDQSIHFDGVVATLRFENPHIALTLTVTKGDGTQGTITFAEGAPANVLERRGVTAADIAVGTPIKAIGAPRHDAPNLYFLKTIILADGRRFTFVE